MFGTYASNNQRLNPVLYPFREKKDNACFYVLFAFGPQARPSTALTLTLKVMPMILNLR